MNYTKRKDGRYTTKIYTGSVNGKPQYKFLYAKTQKELQVKELEFRKSLEKGLVSKSKKDTFKFWAEQTCKAKESELTESEFNLFKFRVNYFVEELGDMKIKSILKLDIQPLIDDLYKQNPATLKKSSRRTVQRYISCCSAVFSYAIENRQIDYNPTTNIKIPKQATSKDRRALTIEEIQLVMSLDHRAKLPSMISLYSGLRRGEVTALLWEDIDLKSQTITVNKSYDFKSNKVKGPKSKAGYRTIPIPSVLRDYLSTVPHSSIYVCPSAHNIRMTESAWKRLWESYMMEFSKRIDNFTEFTFHCLRHTYATILYESNVDVLTAKENLGHSDIKVTLDIYTHLSETHKKKKLENIDEYIESIKKEPTSQ